MHRQPLKGVPDVNTVAQDETDMQKIEELKQFLIKLNKSSLHQQLLDCYKQLFDYLSVGQHGNDKLLIKFNDTLSICLLRMTQQSLDFVIPLTQINDIFDHIVQNSEEASSALFNSLNSILGKLLHYIKKYYSLNETILHQWIDKVINRRSKPSFIILDSLVKCIKDEYFVVNTYPEFLESSLGLLKNDTMANSICKPIISIYSKIYASLQDDLKWLQLWKPLVMDKLSDASTKPAILKHLLPGLFQISPASLQLLIKEIPVTDDQHIDILINLLKIAQDLQIIKYPYKSLSRELLESLMTHEDAEIRIKTLSLILGSSAKNAKSLPIEPEVYEIFESLHVLEIYLGEYENIEIRNSFVSLLQSFLVVRFKESMYSLNKTIHKNPQVSDSIEAKQFIISGEAFFTRLLDQLANYLQPSANYSQMITSMQLLSIILGKLDRDFLTRLNVYESKKLYILLVQNLFNDYENIRNTSLEILLMFPNLKIADESEAPLIEQACATLSSLVGRKSEGGAKAIEFVCKCYSHDSTKVNDLVTLLTNQIGKGIEEDTYVHGHFKALSLIVKDSDVAVDHIELMIEQIMSIWEKMKLNLTTEEIDENQDDSDSREGLNYAWKVIKDSNILLATILAKKVVTNSIFLKCSDLIMEQMASIKHRGSFQSIYPSFIEICGICLATPELSEYPKVWLLNNIHLISSKTQYISRRSGGLPFLITGILIASSKYDTQLVDLTFDKLIEIAQEPVEHIADQRNDLAQVHAFNCMKQIFIDAALSSSCMKYINVCLQLSLRNFNVENWSVRNCAVMLFSSIQQRIFGNTRCYPSHIFFKKFPGIDTIFMENLEQELHQQTNKNPIIFPIIIMLLKLSSNESDIDLNKFKLVLRKFLGNKQFKIRELVGRSIASMFNGIELLEFCKEFFETESSDLNYTHGCLITILEALKQIENQDLYILKLFLENITLYSSNYIVFNYYLQVIQLITKRKSVTIEKQYLNYLGNYMLENIDDNRLDGTKQMALCSLFTFLISQYYGNDNESFRDVIALGLNLNFKVVLQVIELLQSLPINEWVEVHNEIWNLIENPDTWSYVKIRALSAYSQILSEISIDDKSAKTEVLLALTRDENEEVQLGALLCLGSLIEGERRHEFLDMCKHQCQDTNAFENRYTGISALVKFIERLPNDELLHSALLTLYTNGLNNEDDEIRDLTSAFFSRHFKYQFSRNSNYLQYDLIGKLALILNNDEGKKAILSSIVDQMSFTLKVPDSLYGIERDNLFKNEIELVSNLLSILKQLSFSDDSIAALKQQIGTSIRQITEIVDKSGTDSIVGWSKDEFIFVPLIKLLIIIKTLVEITRDHDLEQLALTLKEKLNLLSINHIVELYM